jgi:hypothetical protein
VTGIRWTWLFLDSPRTRADRSWAFWSTVTGWPLSPRRGEHDQFATLVPPRGDSWLKVQAVDDGPGGIHVDLDTEDVGGLAVRAERLGAARAHEVGDSVVVLRSPGGFTFCVRRWQGEAHQVRAGAAELVDQVCLDIPPDRHEREVAFWAALTGWEWADLEEPELSFLRRPDGIPLRLLLQRLDDRTGPVRAHADLACVDRRATLSRHLAAGARVVAEREQWTVMADPVGRVYCLTDRSPTASGEAPATEESP